MQCVGIAAWALTLHGIALAQSPTSPLGAQPQAPSANAATLTAAVARASGEPGWRAGALADGRAVAIGIGPAGPAVYVVGIACGSSRRPEIAVDARGVPALPRALIVETSETVAAFPVDPAGAAPSGVDVITADLLFAEDASAKMWLDNNPFPINGARQALAQVEKDCATRYRWEYGNDHEQQLVWALWTQSDREPSLVFGKPYTGWIVAALSCDRASKELRLSSTGLPRGAKNGQSMPLVIEIGARKLTVNGKVELSDGGDVSGYVVARFRRAAEILDLLRDADQVKLQAKSERLTVAARGVGPLLGRFEAACGFK